MTKRISAMEGMMKTSMVKQIGIDSLREEALNWEDKKRKIIVDTCEAFDMYEWETGIERKKQEGKWVIVEQYESKEEAIIGHKKWIDKIKKNPKVKLEDINLWG